MPQYKMKATIPDGYEPVDLDYHGSYKASMVSRT